MYTGCSICADYKTCKDKKHCPYVVEGDETLDYCWDKYEESRHSAKALNDFDRIATDGIDDEEKRAEDMSALEGGKK